MTNHHAKALGRAGGKAGKGKPKSMTPAAIAQRKKAAKKSAAARKKRRKK